MIKYRIILTGLMALRRSPEGFTSMSEVNANPTSDNKHLLGPFMTLMTFDRLSFVIYEGYTSVFPYNGNSLVLIKHDTLTA